MADIRFLVEDIDDAEDDQDDGCEMDQEEDPSILDQITPEELLSPIIRMEKYMHSDVIFNRQMAARYTKEALKACRTKDDIYHVIRLVVRLSEDIEPCVRVELMEQIPHVALFCYEHFSMMEAVPQNILYIVLHYLIDSNNQVRKTSHHVLLELLRHELVERADVEDQVCPVLMQLTAGDSNDDYRSEAVTLMSKMAPLVGKDITERYFMQRFEILCCDPLFHVRKVCASTYGEICNVVGPELTMDRLLPVFFRLCQDGVWGVRKSCAESFMSVSATSPEDVRTSDLAEVFVSLLCDKSRWVQMAAYQNLGPFISTFADPTKSGFYINDEGMLFPVPRNEEARTEAEPTNYENTGTTESAENNVPDKEPVQRERGSSPEGNTTDSGYISPPDLPNEGNDTHKEDNDIHKEDSDTHKEDCLPDEQNLVPHSCTRESGKCKHCPTTDLDEDLDESYFNSFLYWRTPLPQVEIEVNSINKKNGKAGKGTKTEDDDEDEGNAENSEDKESTGNESKNEEKNTSEERVDIEYDTGKPCENDETPPNSPRMVFGNSNGGDSDEEEHMALFSLTEDTHHDFDYDDYHEMKFRHSTSFEEELLLADHLSTPPHQNVIPQALLDHYISMTEPSKAQTIDTEIARHCAFSFPAVTLTLGRHNWPCLRDTYELLSSDMQWKVRRTLAFSIHELAQVLGEEMTRMELVPIFNSFLKDLDEVRIGVLKHLADFIKLLPSEIRVDYLPVLVDFLSTDNNRNWRFRQELAEQLMHLSELYSPACIQQFVCPIAITLATDRVADVRSIAFKLIGILLRRLHGCEDGDPVRRFVSDIIIKFANSQQWTRRQAYAQLCQSMLEEHAESGTHFSQEFLSSLLALLSDKVPNVRIVVARTLCQSVLNCDSFPQSDSNEKIILTALGKLQSDPDRDVRYFAGSKEEYEENECNATHNAETSVENNTEENAGTRETYENAACLDMDEERTDDFKNEEDHVECLENETAEDASTVHDNSDMILEQTITEEISKVDKSDGNSSSNLEALEERKQNYKDTAVEYEGCEEVSTRTGDEESSSAASGVDTEVCS